MTDHHPRPQGPNIDQQKCTGCGLCLTVCPDQTMSLSGGKAVVHKEYAGGVMAEFEISLPAVVGVQAAHQPPRYCPLGFRRAPRGQLFE